MNRTGVLNLASVILNSYTGNDDNTLFGSLFFDSLSDFYDNVVLDAMKKTIQKILGEGRLRGIFEFIFLFRRHRNPWGGPFNGQEVRKAIYSDILKCCNIETIVETGCFRGATTVLFSESGLPVYTCEIQPRFYIFSKIRFFFRKRTKVFNSDSRSFLKKLSLMPDITNSRCFFYLDAHWEGDLPLREEIQIIFEKWKYPVIMVDDFMVNDDAGYKYDDYGSDKVLNLDYLKVLNFDIVKFFPINSSRETGKKRGSIILTNNSRISEEIAKSEYLRPVSLGE